MIFIDSYSKLLQIEFIRHNTAEETIRELENMFKYLGYPLVLVSDNGQRFSSWKFGNWCKSNLIHLMHFPAYHPQSNEQAKIAVHDVKTLLKRKLQDNPSPDWKQVISDIEKDIRFAQTALVSGKCTIQVLFFS